MGRFFKILCIFVSLWAATSIAFSQVSDHLDIPEFQLPQLLARLRNKSGLQLLTYVAITVQILLLAGRAFLQKVAGIYRVLIMNALTLVGGIIFLRLQGMDWISAALHSQTTAMAQVYFHQFFKQTLKKPKDDYAILCRKTNL